MRCNMRVIFLGVILGLVLIPVQAESGVVRGQSASAIFSNVDEAGCVSTWLEIYFYESHVDRPGGPPGEGVPAINFYLTSYDYCRSTQLYNAYAFTHVSGGAFSSSNSNNLESARLNTVLEIYDDVAERSIPFVLDIRWTAIGEPVRSSYRATGGPLPQRWISRYKAISREAEATGTLFAGTENVLLAPSESAALQAGSGTVTWRGRDPEP